MIKRKKKKKKKGREEKRQNSSISLGEKKTFAKCKHNGIAALFLKRPKLRCFKKAFKSTYF